MYLFGAESFPSDIGEALALGHLSERIPVFGLNGACCLAGPFMDFELSFDPITLLTMSPFERAGESIVLLAVALTALLIIYYRRNTSLS